MRKAAVEQGRPPLSRHCCACDGGMPATPGRAADSELSPYLHCV